MAVICGVPSDDGISDFLKCRITQSIGGVDVTVVGYLTEECTLSLTSLWESPFEGDTVGNAGVIDKGASIVQAQTEKTSKTQWNSQQVWEGIEPPEVTIQLLLVAYSNASQEVDLPIQYLMQMASPELLNTSPISTDSVGGRVPMAAVFNIGRKFISPMRISDVSFDLNAPKTKIGDYAYNTVTLTASPKNMINKSQITNYFL
ncbi:hypothetical protein NB524_00400 [Vibrio alginolyticus]|uniref:hypothetical protein n=1 Tax=Vibrio alginolyticus TaxID=663 RepID=UPI00215D3E15|nr:hypothetical protein [Vibrio alginolyticus]MCR9568822.1 hypothetical protein [Vibrio alginolyticus]